MSFLARRAGRKRPEAKVRRATVRHPERPAPGRRTQTASPAGVRIRLYPDLDKTVPKTTHFGYQQVSVDEKANRVAAVFDSVADKYDVMNDLMSVGIHRAWKRFALELSAARPGQQILDVAAGTGDMTRQFARVVGDSGKVVMTDINAAMLQRGRDRMLDRGVCGNIEYVIADAERLPFPDRSFHCVCIAFGLRNCTDKEKALQAMTRVLIPGGRLLVLEFSKPQNPLLGRIYDGYSFNLLPTMGRLVAGDPDSYRYLAESIRMHPDQETLKGMMEQAGLARVRYHNMTGGIVAAHVGIRP